jgi:trichohyalin
MKQRDEQEARATVQLEEKLKRRWAKAEKLLQAFYALDTTEKTDRSHYQSLQKIIKHVDDVREELLLMQRRRDVKRAQQSANKTEVPPQAVAVDVEEESERRKPEEEAGAGAEAQPTTESGESEAPAEAKKEEEGLVPAEGQQPPTEAEAAGVEEKAEEAVQPLQQVVAQEEEEEEVPKVEQTEEGETSKALEAQPEEKDEKNQEKEEEEEESAQEEEGQANAAPPTAKDDKALVSKEEADEESEQRRRIIEQEREKAMLKIKDVAHSVTRLSDQIEGFTSEATKLDMEAVSQTPLPFPSLPFDHNALWIRLLT